MAGCPSSSAYCKVRLEALVDASSQMRDELLAMVNDPDYSDIRFVCKDGVKVHASRLLVMARSEVLRRMLSNGMAESRMPEIGLPDIPSSALLPTLEYLYTGAITKHEMDLDTAFQVVHAARFFLLRNLEEHLKPRLQIVLFSVNDPLILAQHLSTLVSYCICDDLEDVVELILKRLGEHCTVCPTSFLRHLSSQAMAMYMEFLRSRNPVIVISFMEYLRLRNVLLWSACHVSAEAEAMLDSALPNEESLAPHFHALKSSDKSFLELGLERTASSMTAADQRYVDQVVEFLNNSGLDWPHVVRLRHIHPVILLKVVKPLNVIRPSILVEAALKYQANHAGDMNIFKWSPGIISGSYYETRDNGTLLVAKNNGLRCVPAIGSPANMSIKKPSGVYELEVIVEELAANMSVGVLCFPAYCKSRLGIQIGVLSWTGGRSWFSISRYSKLERNLILEDHKLLDTTFLKRNDCVRVLVDMSSGFFMFSINGNNVDATTVKNFPDEVFLTASCSYPGRLRVIHRGKTDFL